MTDKTKKVFNANDFKSNLIPVECLSDLKSDIISFRETEKLNGFQKWIVNEGYVLDIPELSFKPTSILNIAVRNHLVNVVFNYRGKSLTDLYFMDQIGALRNYLGTLGPKGQYNLEFCYWLPNKRLAVCSGLTEYGRNNITYIDGWGSFFTLYAYMTDMPCESEYIWRDVQNMDLCTSCGLCIQNCPTKAIKGERFLIDNEICFTHFEESDIPFPDWLPERAYQSAFGCFRCLEVCPKNEEVLRNIEQSVNFNEEETALLMDGADRKDMPADLLQKLELLGINDWRLKILPKGLKAVFEHA